MKTFLACTSTRWADDIEHAKALDRMAVRDHGQRDHDHHLCAEQRSQQMRGYMCVKLYQNIHGWCVRDTMNDGLGNLSGNGTREWAEQWARDWRAVAPDRRAVIDWGD